MDEASVLRRSVGKRLVFRLPRTPRDTVSALVLGVDPLRLQLPDGRISFSPPGLALYPSDVVVVEPTAVTRSRRAQGAGQIRLGYFTSGASWQASYQVVLGRTDARVTGMAVLPSESLRAENAEIQLLAGSVSRAAAQGTAPATDGRNGSWPPPMAVSERRHRAAGGRVPPLLPCPAEAPCFPG